MLIVELSVAAPEERPPFDTSEVTDGVEDAGVEAAAVEADDDVNRSPDSISGRENINICLLWQQRKPQGTMGTVCVDCISGSALNSQEVPVRLAHERYIPLTAPICQGTQQSCSTVGIWYCCSELHHISI